MVKSTNYRKTLSHEINFIEKLVPWKRTTHISQKPSDADNNKPINRKIVEKVNFWAAIFADDAWPFESIKENFFKPNVERSGKGHPATEWTKRKNAEEKEFAKSS